MVSGESRNIDLLMYLSLCSGFNFFALCFIKWLSNDFLFALADE